MKDTNIILHCLDHLGEAYVKANKYYINIAIYKVQLLVNDAGSISMEDASQEIAYRLPIILGTIDLTLPLISQRFYVKIRIVGVLKDYLRKSDILSRHARLDVKRYLKNINAEVPAEDINLLKDKLGKLYSRPKLSSNIDEEDDGGLEKIYDNAYTPNYTQNVDVAIVLKTAKSILTPIQYKIIIQHYLKEKLDKQIYIEFAPGKRYVDSRICQLRFEAIKLIRAALRIDQNLPICKTGNGQQKIPKRSHKRVYSKAA